MKKISFLVMMLLAAFMVKAADPVTLFSENFDYGDLENTYQDGPANERGFLEPNWAHYTDEDVQIQQTETLAPGSLPGSSGYRGIVFSEGRQTFTIANLNTEGKKNIKFQYTTMFNWNNNYVQYSLNQGATWSDDLPATVEASSGNWQLRILTLPKATEGQANLWLRIKGGTGYCVSDDILITAVEVTPLDLAETKNLLDFNLSGLTEYIGFDKTRATFRTQPDPELLGNNAPDGAFIAEVAFDETTPLMQNAAGNRVLEGVLAFKGGVIIDQSHYTATNPRKEDVYQINMENNDTSFPNLDIDARELRSHGGNGNGAVNTGNHERITTALVWTKDQFVNGGADERIIINGSSKIAFDVQEFYGNNVWNEQNGIRILIKNGTQYYISEKRWENGGDPITETYENMDAEKWLAFDPSTMEMPIPSDFTASAVVNFDDVQAVGLFIYIAHEWHKTFRLVSFTFDGVLAVPAKGSFDVANKTVAVDSPIKFTTDMAVVNADASEIADADVASLFILKKEGASGADVAFDGTVDAEKKVFTLTPSADFDYETTYYVALKDNVIANAGSFATGLTEATFKTVADIAALDAAIAAAQAQYDVATEGSESGQYDAGSKAIFLTAINAAKAALTGTQAQVDAAVTALAAAVVEFGKAEVGLNEGVTVTITVAETNAAIATTIAAVAGSEVFNALDGSEITNATNLFVLKEGAADGADVAFSATIDEKKNFTITPAGALKPLTAYYVALKNRVVADADGVRAALVSKTFTTGVDSTATLAKIAEAEGVYATAGEEGLKNGDIIAGSKATFQAAIDAAYVAMRAAATQAELLAVEGDIDSAISAFNAAKVVVNYDALNAAVTTAKAIKNASDYATKYDEATRIIFEAALTAAEAMSVKTDATQAEVDAAKSALEAAQAGLVTIGVDGANIGLAIYPNPADNFIKVNGVSDVTLNIFTVGGAQVLSVGSYSGEEIEISSLPAGTYLVKVAGTTVTLIKK